MISISLRPYWRSITQRYYATDYLMNGSIWTWLTDDFGATRILNNRVLSDVPGHFDLRFENDEDVVAFKLTFGKEVGRWM